jgi:hypothetical protein
MTVTIHPRETGATVRCDYHACSAKLTTGQILIRPIRAYAKTQGWIRGLDPGSGDADGGRPSNRRWDVCPTHAIDERRKCDERRQAGAARRARRDDLLKMTPEERTAERRRLANAAAKARRAKQKALKAMLPTVAA